MTMSAPISLNLAMKERLVLQLFCLTFLLLAYQPAATAALTMQFVNESSPLRPTFVVNFDISSIICQGSADSHDLRMFPISSLCNDQMECYPSPAMSDESFPFCSTECSPGCSGHGACLKDGKAPQCFCDQGYSGKSCEVEDANECSESPCHLLARCTNTYGSYYCSCLPGFTGDGSTNCEDIIECDDDSIAHSCPPNSECCNVPGSHFCNCTEGYIPVGHPLEKCQDIDECKTGMHDCTGDQQCVNTDGGFECVELIDVLLEPSNELRKCQTGYESENGICIDIDECVRKELHNCDPRAKCINTPGSYTCKCENGFRGSGLTCQPIGTCATNEKICHPNAFCQADLGECFCQKGFIGNGIVCEDLNECDNANVPCSSRERCVNIVGAFVCCSDSFTDDECLEDQGIPDFPKNNDDEPIITGDGDNRVGALSITEICKSDFSCGNDSFCDRDSGVCRCKQGFIGGPPDKPCIDADECVFKLHDCSDDAECVNVAGGFKCQCAEGFRSTSRGCEDINECLSDPCHHKAECINTEGSFQCNCEGGYYGDGYTCKPEDTVACWTDVQKSRCTTGMECHVKEADGTVICMRCAKGYSAEGFDKCVDVNECDQIPTPCHPDAKCTNTAGGFACECSEGYQGDGFFCEDINECLVAGDYCHPQSTCFNQPGSYSCLCGQDLEGDGAKSCVVPLRSECATSASLVVPVCPDKAFCVDHEGGFYCQCSAGYKPTDDACIDIDECAENRHNCDERTSTCVNVEGSFVCSCNNGYHGIGNICTDIDECVVSKPCDPNAKCSNTPGSFDCNCQPNFQGDGFTCGASPDLNIPIIGDSAVGESERTSSTSSTTKVTFAPQTVERTTSVTEQESTTSRDIPIFVTQPEESKNWRPDGNDPESNCPSGAIWDCMGHNMTCRLSEITGKPDCHVCKRGFEGEPHFCYDRNECEQDAPCDPNAVCINAVGSFTCTCFDGFEGDGFICTSLTAVSECSNPVANDCHQHAECVDIQPSGHFCVCNEGFIGDGRNCDDVDECYIRNICDEHATCANSVGSFTCQCKEGYTGDGQFCLAFCPDGQNPLLEIGSCEATSNTCPIGYICHNTRCCPDPDSKNCNTNLSVCHIDARCIGTQCVCNNGFRGDGFDCEDIDECSEGRPCRTNELCVNRLASFECCTYESVSELCQESCNCETNPEVCHEFAKCVGGKCVCEPGFLGNGLECTIDPNDCIVNPELCNSNAVCTEDRHTCICKDGFTGDGVICTPDEGANDQQDCLVNVTLCHPNGECQGDGSCRCTAGYLGDGIRCTEDPDDCVLNTRLCGQNARCVDRRCRCNDRYDGDGRQCRPLDAADCQLNEGLCHTNGFCHEDSRRCSCNPGYLGDGINCVPDPNDCIINANLCRENAICQDRRCSCKLGFIGDGQICNPIDPDDCDIQPSLCHPEAKCVGGRCKCDPGLLGDGIKTCKLDPEDCIATQGLCSVNADCVDRRCVCKEGFNGDGKSCEAQDPDDCSRQPSICHTEAECTEENRCQCKEGYLGDGRWSCVPDPDDCGYGSAVCHEEAECIDRRCICKEGFVGDGKHCVAVDEDSCRARPEICAKEAECRADRCRCLIGYLGNGRICTPDPDDCQLNILVCHRHAICTDRRCNCKTGYTGSGTNCYPIDAEDCLVQRSICDRNAACVTRSFQGEEVGRCVCNEQYEGDGRNCNRVTTDTNDPCDASVSDCSQNAVCRPDESLLNGRQCICMRGYKGDGRTCTDVNECDENPCHSKATCTNIGGSFTCTCQPGFAGDGRTDCKPRDVPERDGVDVECEGDAISLLLQSGEPFLGRIFVKSQSRNPYCSKDYAAETGPLYKFSAPFDHCDITKEPEENTFSVIVVIQKHPLFITEEAIAYKLKCTYPTGEKMVTSHFNVSMISTHATYVEQAPMGRCSLHVLTPDGSGTVANAIIGEMLQLQLRVTPPDVYGVFAKSCYAVNMDDGDTYALTDENGCAVDDLIFSAWQKINSSVVYTNFMTFKWPDTANIRFQCDCMLCFKECEPANCGNGRSSYGRKRRFAIFQATDETATLDALPVFSSIISVEDTSETGGKGAEETEFDHLGMDVADFPVILDAPSSHPEQFEMDDEICFPQAAFGLTIALATFLGLAMMVVGSYGFFRKGNFLKTFIYQDRKVSPYRGTNTPVGIVNPVLHSKSNSSISTGSSADLSLGKIQFDPFLHGSTADLKSRSSGSTQDWIEDFDAFKNH